MSSIGLTFFILYWVVFVYSVVLHELAHGWVAYKLGDPTAANAGRLTLDPIKHIDPMQTIVMPLLLFVMSSGQFIFGGAKPVPVNPYLYKNQRYGIIMDSAAGPMTNIIIAMIFGMGLTVSSALSEGEPTLTGKFLSCCMMINIFLAAFNMLPIPPLDGSHVLQALLPKNLAEGFEKLRSMGFMLLIILLVMPGTSNLIHLVIGLIVKGFLSIMGIETIPAWSPMELIRR